MEVDELIWQYNKERAIESLYDDKIAMVGSYTRRRKISD